MQAETAFISNGARFKRILGKRTGTVGGLVCFPENLCSERTAHLAEATQPCNDVVLCCAVPTYRPLSNDKVQMNNSLGGIYVKVSFEAGKAKIAKWSPPARRMKMDF